MKDNLSKLVEEKLFAIAERIVGHIACEKIWCFAASESITTRFHCFGEETRQHTFQFQLLVVLADEERQPNDKLGGMLETECQEIANITVVICRWQEMQASICNQQPFLCTITNSALLLYDSYRCPQPIPEEPRKLRLNTRWKAVLKNAWNFHEATRFFTNDAEARGMLVFLLHQSFELACKALLLKAMHYWPETRDPVRLLHLVEGITPSVQKAFPCNTVQEQKALKILSQGHALGRTKDVGNLDAGVIGALQFRVAVFLEWVEEFVAHSNPAGLPEVDDRPCGK
jgi:hypothetical protein